MRATILVLLAVVAAPLAAQTRSDAEVKRLLALHEGDFDYLLGDWAFTTVDKEFGAGQGVWSAVKLEGGQILDEYRVLGDSGQTWYLLHTIRSYNVSQDRWELIGLDRGSGLSGFGTATRNGNEVRLEQASHTTSGVQSMWKIRYYDITQDHFRWEGALSRDGGKSWTPRWLTIEARRTGPARTLPRLTPK